jgi:hypothetical protein
VFRDKYEGNHKHGLRVSERLVLKEIPGLKEEEVIGEWGKLPSEELHNSHPSSNVTQVSKSGGMRWAGHVACKEERRGAHRVLVGKLRKRRHLEYLCVGGSITLEWVSNKIK